ncbi:sigma-70 family RNA polymerase sigma factor [Empedobacter stercoris]|uniref:Sigma-70 family RNA polymerase sigma factor n=1 Tax=Empedobacter falsenii TaxID=343874 RepID=A0ABY8V6F6_9FLAO|nr:MULTISPECIES: sigma-70 family RNA polymerase sigma factor [Empedobacter]MCA4775908.1 sigma-70 family RNA polymerase sigma factor [Empedobacter stercoris]UWX65950.1 sigma-70 family RNA polymerase sigma factor [Empedobacter stercoris]WIH96163.1 sigma-70 family RNA polymerase sigma factor [Empedobacter falsenii]
MNKDSLEYLIKQCQEQNRKAQEEIYLEFSPVLFSICLRYAESYEDAQDIFQEGFIHIFNKVNQFKFEGSFEGWMKRIMVNLNLEKLKKKNTLPFEDYEKLIITQDDDEDIEDNFDYQQLLEVVHNLPPQYRQVFNLYVFEEFTHQEIAEMLNISVGTSKSNLSRARNLLKQKLNLLKTVNK